MDLLSDHQAATPNRVRIKNDLNGLCNFSFKGRLHHFHNCVLRTQHIYTHTYTYYAIIWVKRQCIHFFNVIRLYLRISCD